RQIEFDPTWTQPVGARDILTRMLNNLKFGYLHRGELALALATVDRLVALRPDLPQELRDRGLLRLALGEPLLGFTDLMAYLDLAPNAPEIGRLRRRLSAMRMMRAQLN
ncbi:MAG TPA: tetratricopeptide repeat protein, partial [Ktedonobacterales bacterium]|nr:tetratricopeptide repeat protein [Ktedonobacterales bacterium]